jgi:hypothetical protein
MVYYKIKNYTLIGYDKSKTKGKMYDAILERKSDNKIIKVPFGSNQYNNYRDISGLNLYPQLINPDKERRRLYKIRHKKDLRKNYYSPGYFSYNILW